MSWSGLEKGSLRKGSFHWRILNFLYNLYISRKWSDSPLFSTVWGFSWISKFSRLSRKWTFLKRPLFQKTPFSEPELKAQCSYFGTHSNCNEGNLKTLDTVTVNPELTLTTKSHTCTDFEECHFYLLMFSFPCLFPMNALKYGAKFKYTPTPHPWKRPSRVGGVYLVAPCGWELNRGRGRGWESRPLSRFCFALVLKGF